MSLLTMIFSKSTIFDCEILQLPVVHKQSGNITSINSFENIPFDIKRIYYLYDIPGGEERGGHAHRNLFQLLVAAGGAFEVSLFDGVNRKIVHLDRPNIGLYIVPGIWRELLNFSSGSICLVLASLPYSEEDYIRDYTYFTRSKNL